MDVMFVKLLLDQEVSVGMLIESEDIGSANVKKNGGGLSALVNSIVV